MMGSAANNETSQVAGQQTEQQPTDIQSLKEKAAAVVAEGAEAPVENVEVVAENAEADVDMAEDVEESSDEEEPEPSEMELDQDLKEDLEFFAAEKTDVPVDSDRKTRGLKIDFTKVNADGDLLPEEDDEEFVDQ